MTSKLIYLMLFKFVAEDKLLKSVVSKWHDMCVL